MPVGLEAAHTRAARVFHTYSTFGRGLELMNTTYQLLDLVPKGRDETDLPGTMSWVKYGYDYAQSA